MDYTKLFAAVILKHSREKLVVPIKWVGNLDVLQIFNIGISHTKDHLVYFSKKLSEEPDFTAEKRQYFDEDGSFCYDGKVLHIWGKIQKFFFTFFLVTFTFAIFYGYVLFSDTYENAERFLNSRRKLLPAIYNANLERYHFNPTEHVDAQPCIKQEPLERIVFPNEPGLVFFLDDSDDDFDDATPDQLIYEADSDNETVVEVSADHENDTPNLQSNIIVGQLGSSEHASIEANDATDYQKDSNIGALSNTQDLANSSEPTDDDVGSDYKTNYNIGSLNVSESSPTGGISSDGSFNENRENSEEISYADESAGINDVNEKSSTETNERESSMEIQRSLNHQNDDNVDNETCSNDKVNDFEPSNNVQDSINEISAQDVDAAVKKEIVFPNEPGVTIDLSDDDIGFIRDVIAYDSDEDMEQTIEIEYNHLSFHPKRRVKNEIDGFDLVTGKILVDINVRSNEYVFNS